MYLPYIPCYTCHTRVICRTTTVVHVLTPWFVLCILSVTFCGTLYYTVIKGGGATKFYVTRVRIGDWPIAMGGGNFFFFLILLTDR